MGVGAVWRGFTWELGRLQGESVWRRSESDLYSHVANNEMYSAGLISPNNLVCVGVFPGWGVHVAGNTMPTCSL